MKVTPARTALSWILPDFTIGDGDVEGSEHRRFDSSCSGQRGMEARYHAGAKLCWLVWKLAVSWSCCRKWLLRGRLALVGVDLSESAFRIYGASDWWRC